MTKTWENYPCEFFTGNTTNGNGDSRYSVAAHAMWRYAPINAERRPDQVVTGNPSIAYLDPSSNLYRAIIDQLLDKHIQVLNVIGDIILIKVNVRQGLPDDLPVIAPCSRKPANGLCTFDFHNNNGVLTHIHVGHAVKLLRFIRPRRNAIFRTDVRRLFP